MVVGEIPEGIDLLVIGGGPGGYVAALRGSQLGRSVTLVDRAGPAGLGGVCVNVGCIPSKALIETARSTWRARHVLDHGVRVHEVDLNLAEFQVWRRSVVSGLSGGIAALLKQAHVKVVTGVARFTRPDTVAVETERDTVEYLQFKDCILATGSRPVTLANLVRDGVRILDSTDALALEDLPGRVVVVGAGYIGLEVGTALAQLGSSVTIIEAQDSLLPGLDRDILRPVERRLGELGITLLTRTQVVQDTGTSVRTCSTDGQMEGNIACDVIVVAVGRTPNTDELGLDLADIEVGDRGFLAVRPDRRVNQHIAAIGDIVAGPALAHKAMAEGHVAAEALCGMPSIFDPAAIPAVVFSDPEVALTGLSAETASNLGYNARVSKFPLSASGRIATLGRKDGFVKLVSDANSGVILGAQFVGEHVSELIGEATLAIEMAATVEDLAATIHPHPTVSESMMDAAFGSLGRPIHFSAKNEHFSTSSPAPAYPLIGSFTKSL